MLGCTVGELCQRMSVAEFTEWLLMEEVEGLGHIGELRRHHRLLAATANGPLSKADKALWVSDDFAPQAGPWAHLAGASEPAPVRPLDVRSRVAHLNETLKG